jgi:hypothetical protein
MRALFAVLLLSMVPQAAFAVFSSLPLPEPGVLELVGLAGVAVVVVRLLTRRK